MRFFSLFIVFLFLTFSANAQNGSVSITPIYDDEYVAQNFCGAVMNLLTDAGNKFGKAKGKEIETHGDVAIWTSNIGMPGAVTSSLLFTNLWRYEGVVYQGISEMEMMAAYKKYKGLLEGCMNGKGYFVSSEKNTDPKLENFPAAVYTKPVEGSQHNAHISMEAAYEAQTNTYTLSVNVWE